MQDSQITSWATKIDAITLFVEDLAATKQFYRELFGLQIHFEDENSAVFAFGEALVNRLKSSEAHELIAPAEMAAPGAGSRMQFTIGVDDVDAMCAELARRGVELLNGPMDRPGASERPASATPLAISGRSRSNLPKMSDFVSATFVK